MTQIFCVGVEQAETGVPPADMHTEVRKQLRFEKRLIRRRKRGKELNTSQEDEKTDKNCGLHFGVVSEKRSHTRRKPLKTKLEDKHARTTTENQEEYSRFVSALFFST